MSFVVDILDFNALLVFCVAFLLAIWFFTRPKNLPPGPFALPIIGNFIQLAQNRGKLHTYFQKLGQQYGGLFTFKMGPKPAVILTDYDIIKEALVKRADVFSARPVMRTHQKTSNMYDGVIMGNGPKWKSLRRLTLVALRDFGVGKKSLEQRINEEARAVLEVIRKTDGKPFKHRQLLQAAVSNIICSVVFGSRFEYEDAMFKRLVDIINFNLTAITFGDGSNIISKILSYSTRQKRSKNVEDLNKFIDDQIKEHRDTFDPSNIRDFVDLHIDGQNKHEVIESTAGASLHRTIQDLFVAGTETTSTTLNWALLYMVRYPEVQRRCHEEIDQVIGRSRQPSLADRQKCTYIEATIMEIQRRSTIVPLGVPHAAAEDTMLRGYNIPRNTMLMVDLYAVHMDPKLWNNPKEFSPQRWLDGGGQIKKNDTLIPFSIGPRACLGEILARMELFLFFTSLLQEFEFKMVDKNNPPSLDGHFGITYAPTTFSVCAVPR